MNKSMHGTKNALLSITHFRVGQYHITLLEVEEEELVLIKENLLDNAIRFDHFDHVNDIEVMVELRLTLAEVELSLATDISVLSILKAARAGTRQALQAIEDEIQPAVAKLDLINDQVVYSVERLP